MINFNNKLNRSGGFVVPGFLGINVESYLIKITHYKLKLSVNMVLFLRVNQYSTDRNLNLEVNPL